MAQTDPVRLAIEGTRGGHAPRSLGLPLRALPRPSCPRPARPDRCLTQRGLAAAEGNDGFGTGVGAFRKLHLFGRKPELSAPGDVGLPVVELDAPESYLVANVRAAVESGATDQEVREVLEQGAARAGVPRFITVLGAFGQSLEPEGPRPRADADPLRSLAPIAFDEKRS